MYFFLFFIFYFLVLPQYQNISSVKGEEERKSCAWYSLQLKRDMIFSEVKACVGSENLIIKEVHCLCWLLSVQKGY